MSFVDEHGHAGTTIDVDSEESTKYGQPTWEFQLVGDDECPQDERVVGEVAGVVRSVDVETRVPGDAAEQRLGNGNEAEK